MLLPLLWTARCPSEHPSESSRAPAHSTVCTLKEGAALRRSHLYCLQKGLCQALTARSSQERMLWKETRILTLKMRGFLPPSPLAYHGEIAANISKAADISLLILSSPPTRKKIQEMPDFDSSCQAQVMLPNRALKLFLHQIETPGDKRRW